MSNQALASEQEVSVNAEVTGTLSHAGVVILKRAICQGVLSIVLMTAGCNPTETVFHSNFDPTPIDQPPAQQQAVGTVTVDGGVRVAMLPGTNSKGVRLSRISGSNEAKLHCNLSKPTVDGTYVYSSVLLFPSGSGGLVTIQFEGAGQQFLHVDISPGCKPDSPSGCFRIDDDETTRFGKYQLDQAFIVQVTLTINEAPTAHVVISGAGGSGEATRIVSPPFRPFARQFSKVNIFSGLQADVSDFFATNILVTHKL